jgi:hypothetical protein
MPQYAHPDIDYAKLVVRHWSVINRSFMTDYDQLTTRARGASQPPVVNQQTFHT